MPLLPKNELLTKYPLQDNAKALDWALMQEIYTKCESIKADLERIWNVDFVKYRI